MAAPMPRLEKCQRRWTCPGPPVCSETSSLETSADTVIRLREHRNPYGEDFEIGKSCSGKSKSRKLKSDEPTGKGLHMNVIYAIVSCLARRRRAGRIAGGKRVKRAQPLKNGA